jgi:hypothetical protein
MQCACVILSSVDYWLYNIFPRYLISYESYELGSFVKVVNLRISFKIHFTQMGGVYGALSIYIVEMLFFCLFVKSALPKKCEMQFYLSQYLAVLYKSLQPCIIASPRLVTKVTYCGFLFVSYH